jgi:uncharacterized membrane protein (UPF0127 family)
MSLPLKIQVAQGFWQRLLGLIPHTSLAGDEALYFPNCNAIHTFFMKFPIDCVFVSSSFQVVDILEDLPPNRMTWPRWKATSVLELKAGAARVLKISVGDQLHVSH